ncbi:MULTISPECIES: Zn-ribbon domain-containing OB-fold protein [Novosphingobium]|uniref:ChsH2 C-terminal OB-fold domain-containing protein n=1 Tax=Novosphingobium mathurense TaxID=428990 RepID=A0A1U6HVE0_9SPHN|nr:MULTISPECIES: OB-fold domain-containing protein [Novosphingobium]CDO35165.1 conserved hypothetical protein [Novosphingobium sp. KN65.2]SLJ99736.1 hypothetical protein SAMN06295987_103153 [Novosphingobium mathurense]
MSGPETYWRTALGDGRFLLQRAPDGTAVFPPRVAVPGSGVGTLEWFEACGRGTVYSLSWINRRAPAEPYNVALIDLDEGARLMSRVEGVDAESLKIGMRVEAFIEGKGEEAILLFRPAEGAA